ncbi:Adenylate cyclase type 2 like protein [Argiope bruennichi]|uniref:Adenylate cyclase type 2 like protein n=1 Tax=Argiope bruennichi TaxID=94029 RepID=A0A8T0ELA1_ARGBR|nr:Adenylate cyclase type 2 like protein [Argiope bruennichi]
MESDNTDHGVGEYPSMGNVNQCQKVNDFCIHLLNKDVERCVRVPRLPFERLTRIRCVNSYIFRRSRMNPSMDVEDLKKRYCGRLQHSLFLSLLLICIFYGAAFLLLVTVVYPHDIWEDHVRIFTISSVVGILVVFFVILVPLERSFAHCSWLVSAAVWLCLLAVLVVCSYSRTQRRPTDNALFVYLAVFVSHTMLSLPLLVACVIAVLTGLSQVALEGMLANTQTENLAKQVGACALFLTCGTLIGYFHRRMTDASHDKTFAGTRFFIESRIKLEYEKEQQEQLLLSVIPAYIAAEVKRSIMLKMADACQSANSHSKQRFHELYVQRHNNVSILYADIRQLYSTLGTALSLGPREDSQ